MVCGFGRVSKVLIVAHMYAYCFVEYFYYMAEVNILV